MEKTEPLGMKDKTKYHETKKFAANWNPPEELWQLPTRRSTLDE
jgi:hypothetical protein